MRLNKRQIHLILDPMDYLRLVRLSSMRGMDYRDVVRFLLRSECPDELILKDLGLELTEELCPW